MKQAGLRDASFVLVACDHFVVIGEFSLGIRRVELSWVLEDNAPMRHLAESVAARPYKTYRVYEKLIAPI